MEDRISTSQAAEIMGVAVSTVRDRARRHGWDIQRVDEGPGSHHTWMCLRSEVVACAAYYASKLVPPRARSRKDKGAMARTVRDWVDGLTKWPTDSEIAAQVSDSYQAKDIESVLETRVFRKVDGEFLEPLRVPAMVRR